MTKCEMSLLLFTVERTAHVLITCSEKVKEDTKCILYIHTHRAGATILSV
jgi:hypothetical protein